MALDTHLGIYILHIVYVQRICTVKVPSPFIFYSFMSSSLPFPLENLSALK